MTGEADHVIAAAGALCLVTAGLSLLLARQEGT